MTYVELFKMLPEEKRMRVKDLVKRMKSEETDIVKVNVGGTIFCTSRSTLTRKIKKENGDEFYGTHLLQGLFEELETNTSQIPFIDRDPAYFNYILDYLRDPNEELLLTDDEFILKKILREAKFFMLDGLSVKIEDHLSIILMKFNSSIINTNQVKDLIQLCGFPDRQRFKLLYRATVHGFSALNFHSKCDKQSNTLTIIKSTSGNIFGGFTSKSWSRANTWVNDPEAFIFSLINSQEKPIKFDCKYPPHAIFCRADCGPSFGSGHDIHICNDSNTNQSSYCSLYNSYKNDQFNFLYRTEETRSFLAGSDKFLTTEIEVFQIHDMLLVQ